MYFLNRISYLITRYRKNSFREVADGPLIVLGVASFLVAGYLGLMLKDAVPEFVKITNENGISLMAVGLALSLGVFGLMVWCFGCLATRCHTIIYERWFK